MAHGAGAFSLEMVRLISKNTDSSVIEIIKNVLGFDIDSMVLKVASFLFSLGSC